jgi:hypothetical protein
MFEESSSYFYRLNVFSFSSISDLFDFMRRLPSSRRRHISQIMFRYDTSQSTIAGIAFRYLTSMPNLRKLYIDIDMRRWSQGSTNLDKLPVIGTYANFAV